MRRGSSSQGIYQRLSFSTRTKGFVNGRGSSKDEVTRILQAQFAVVFHFSILPNRTLLQAEGPTPSRRGSAAYSVLLVLLDLIDPQSSANGYVQDCKGEIPYLPKFYSPTSCCKPCADCG